MNTFMQWPSGGILECTQGKRRATIPPCKEPSGGSVDSWQECVKDRHRHSQACVQVAQRPGNEGFVSLVQHLSQAAKEALISRAISMVRQKRMADAMQQRLMQVINLQAGNLLQQNDIRNMI